MYKHDIQAHVRQGDYKTVERLCHTAQTQGVQDVYVEDMLGVALIMQGRMPEAAEHLKQATHTYPKAAQLWANLGVALQECGDVWGAAHALEQANALKGGQYNTLYNLGVVYDVMGDVRRGCTVAAGLHNMFPQDIHAATLYARLLALCGEHEKAQNVLSDVEESAQNEPEYWLALARLMCEKQEKDACEKACENLLGFEQLTPVQLLSCAEIYGAFGLFEAEKKVCARVLESQPNHVIALCRLVQRASSQEKPAYLDRLLALVGDQKVQTREHAELHHTLFEVYHVMNEPEKAFQHLHQAGDMMAGMVDVEEETEKTVRYLENVQDIVGREEGGEVLPVQAAREAVHVFIVGFPRSGTSLTERILAQHSRVLGVGEVDFLKHVIHRVAQRKGLHEVELLAKGEAEDFDEIRRAYDAHIAMVNPEGLPYVVNKMPENYMYVPFIVRAFPHAKIIHTKRQPEATCFSCYRQLFRTGHAYSDHLPSLAKQYNAYAAMMTTCEAAYGAHIFSLMYEELTSDMETQAKALLAFLGLTWEEACREFYRAKATTKTASVAQVRQPIYTTANETWRRYEAQLQPLLGVLNSAR